MREAPRTLTWTGPHLVPQEAVVHGRQPVMDGGRSVLAQGLPGRRRVHVAVFQGLHHGLADFFFNLFSFCKGQAKRKEKRVISYQKFTSV